MGYRRNNYSLAGGYDSTGRWRSEAWHMDGGANDEGWHNAYCGYCNKNTEHGRHSSGSYCVTCDDRQRAYRARQNVSMVNVGKYVVKTYPGGKSYCNCKGFQFRKTCKHIEQK